MATTRNSTTPTCELCGEPATLVGEQWTCGNCSPVSEPAHATIAVADILDFLTDAVDAARAAAADSTRWRNAIDAAWDHLLQQDVIEYDHAAHELVYRSESGATYYANGSCQCPAFEKGQPCKHRAAARLVYRAVEACDLAAELRAEAQAAGEGWYDASIARTGARWRLPELEQIAREWDAAAVSLQARIGAAQARAMARPLAA